MRTARFLIVPRSNPCISVWGMHNPHFVGRLGGSAQPPRMQTPLDADPLETEPSVCRPLLAMMTCDVCWEANLPSSREQNDTQV